MQYIVSRTSKSELCKEKILSGNKVVECNMTGYGYMLIIHIKKIHILLHLLSHTCLL